MSKNVYSFYYNLQEGIDYMELSIITIGSFVAILNQGTKYIAKNFIKRDVSKWIPVCSVVYGIVLGIIGFFMPDVEMGNNLLEAIFIGISSGSASTGIHQIYVQQVQKHQGEHNNEANDE